MRRQNEGSLLIKEAFWRTLCAHYQLGNPVAGPPQPVTGGMQHRIYRASAVSGDYAVKVLDAQRLREPGRHAHYVQAERLARQMAQLGLPAVCALNSPEGPLLTVEATTVALFPWREGIVLPPHAASAEAAGQIGRLLGRIHQIAPPVPQSSEAPADSHAAEEWVALTEEGQRQNAAWAGALREALSDIIAWSTDSRDALNELAGSQVWTHRDLDQKNVLWSDPNTPWLLDWEGAGPLTPSLEVMGTALNWAGQAAGTPHAAPFLAFARGYKEIMPLTLGSLLLASRAVPDKWLVWLKFNMRRSVFGAQAGSDEYNMACGAVTHALATLYSLQREAAMRGEWCHALSDC